MWVEAADDALNDSVRAHTSHVWDRRYERLAALRSIATVQKVLSSTGGALLAALQCQAACSTSCNSGGQHSQIPAAQESCMHIRQIEPRTTVYLLQQILECFLQVVAGRGVEGTVTTSRTRFRWPPR